MTVYLYCLISFVLSFVGLYAMIGWLKRRHIFDQPNERSNHKEPVPRGGGIVVVVALLIGVASVENWWLAAGILLLAAISWWDDVKSLPAKWRLSVHLVVVIVSLLSPGGHFFISLFPSFLPDPLIIAALALGWVWFINLYNFMDGIDGITGVETLTIIVGMGLVQWVGGNVSSSDQTVGLIVIGSIVAFLCWNWHPAKIFMGDVGSIPLGYIIGWCLLALAVVHPISALILPLYYLSDSGYTIVKRAIKGEKIWQAHSQHFYQQAVRAGLSHQQVVLRIIGLNVLLIALAIWAVHMPSLALLSLAVALLLTAALLYHFHRLSRS